VAVVAAWVPASFEPIDAQTRRNVRGGDSGDCTSVGQPAASKSKDACDGCGGPITGTRHTEITTETKEKMSRADPIECEDPNDPTNTCSQANIVLCGS
jgi:hypothetical protein